MPTACLVAVVSRRRRCLFCIVGKSVRIPTFGSPDFFTGNDFVTRNKEEGPTNSRVSFLIPVPSNHCSPKNSSLQPAGKFDHHLLFPRFEVARKDVFPRLAHKPQVERYVVQ